MLKATTTIINDTYQLRHTGNSFPVVEIHNNIVKVSSDEYQQISISFRQLPYDIVTNASKLNIDSVDKKTYAIKISEDISQENHDRRYIQSSQLEYSGSFSRGINAGNNQDLVLNSDFNLQMQGDLGNGLKIKAAVSDDNIPIQPQGNTQVLQEFNKVYVELSQNKTKVVAGDYELKSPKGYFMNYFKKLKGASADHSHDMKKGWTARHQGSFAISRGKFKRIILNTEEGNQGPYRLEGERGDLFLQVLSGTEKVYADGKLLTRGDNNDYVIDYNRGELRFTTNRIITANLRIIVEYEFATQNYVRSLYSSSNEFSKKKSTFSINFYNEQDSKSLSGNIRLDSIDLAALESSGDNTAFKSGIFIPEENDFSGIIKYTLDTDNILTYTPDIDEDIVAARFSQVGNIGSYTIDTNSPANGRVYKYVGEGNGEFDPVILLTAPEKRQLITSSYNYSLSDSTNIYLEGSMSNFDINRLSSIGNNDNLGFAFHSKIDDIRVISKAQKDSTRSKSPIILKSGLSLELKQDNFRFLNPYRAPEFQRDWNISPLDSTNNQVTDNQLLISANVGISKGASAFNYSLEKLSEAKNYDGIRHGLNIGIHTGKWSLLSDNTLLLYENNISNQSGNFFRPKAELKRKFKNNWLAGFYFEKEQNISSSNTNDSLSIESFDYNLYKYYLTKKLSKNIGLTVNYSRRYDYRPRDNSMQFLSLSEEYGFTGSWKQGTHSNLDWGLTLRDFTEALGGGQETTKKTLLGRVDHNLKMLKNGISIITYIEANSGQQPLIEFQYVEVQKGQGSYIWEDFNQDSLIQISEFRLTPQPDLGNYERISVFNNEFINSNKNTLNQTIKIIPKKFLNSKRKLINKFQYSTRYRTEQQTSSDDSNFSFAPNLFDTSDSTIISYNATSDHNLFYNRGQVSHDVQLSYRTQNNIVTQVVGKEQRMNHELYLRSRINIKKNVDIILELSKGQRDFVSESFSDQDFLLQYWKIIPKINYRPTNKLRVVGEYSYSAYQNKIGQEETARLRDIGASLTWRNSKKSNLNTKIDYVNISYDGRTNSTVGFEILSGLKVGNNLLWNCNYTRRVGKNFDLILTYNGRKSEATQVINTFGVQLRAIF